MDSDFKNLTAQTNPEAAPARKPARLPIGVVAIGRNEGERLKRCLESVVEQVMAAVYVDSGSTDGSVMMARELGVEVVEIDMNQPFTAARARNAGWRRLLEIASDLDYVQFVDGDCEVVPHLLSNATEVLNENPGTAVVCGRRRERFPEKTIYNLMCDIEWDTPIGIAKACGGDAMMRVDALQKVGGYNDSLIAGEEPELCVRLRTEGYEIRRIDHEMTLHDAAMIRFGQWWKRNVRSGYAYAEGSRMHGAPPENHFKRESRSAWFWGLVVPCLILCLAWPTRGWSLLLFLGYPVLFSKVYRALLPRIRKPKDTLTYSFFVVLGKFPEVAGQVSFAWNRMLGKQQKLIEYK